MRERQPPAKQDHPQDVADRRTRPRVRPPYDPAAKRPQRETGDAEGGDSKGDRDNQDEREDPR
jgi:hypothetical protein